MVDAIKALMSNPLDGNMQSEIKNLIKSVLETFTTSYVKNYALFLVKQVFDDAASDPGPDWKLEERPPRTEPYKEGLVKKEGGFFSKSFNGRYFVVRPDYFIDYYEDEAKKQKGKKRGTISLCGYYVNEDANNGILQILTKLAEKMGVDLSGLPKPKEYPKNTMELHHSRRETFYICIEDDAEFKKWVEMMRTCCWRAYGFKNKDEVHKKAFNQAISDTRQKLGRWGYWSYGGTEEQVLSDLIAEEIDWTVMGRVYEKIAGPWSVRWAVRNQVLKVIDKLVLAAVTPAWKVMDTAVSELRPKIEPKVKEVIEPLGKLKLEVMTKIKDACMSIITPVLKEHVVPHLSKIMEVIQSPMVDAFKESFKIYNEEAMGKFEPKPTAEENKKNFSHIDYVPHSWMMYEATRQVDVMYDPLWALNIIFPDIYPWSLIWTAHDTLRGKLDNAIYTFEKRLLEGQEKGEDAKALTDRLKGEVLADFQHDAKIATTHYYRHILKKIVMPPFNKIVFPAAATVIDPINNTIPDPMKQFVDINDMFQHICTGVIDDSISTILEGK